MDKLHRKAFGGLVFLLLVMVVLLFGPAGGLAYWQAWVFLVVYFGLSLAITLDLIRHDPQLLARRMSGGPTAEKETTQKIIMWIASVGFFALLIVPSLDHRFGWSRMPAVIALAGDALVLLGWYGIFRVFRENTFSSATIEIAPDQTVISTGPYARVRHPMYACALAMLAGIPIALGSWWGLAAFVVVIPALIWRLLDEEQFLARNLAGYAEYQSKVRYRLIPNIW